MASPGPNSGLLAAQTPSRPPSGAGAAPRPVMLATLSVRIDPEAERFAIETALETGARLLIVNLLTLPPYPATIMLARQYATLPHEEDIEAVRASAARAQAQGVATELLRVTSRRPLQALLELVAERNVGLLALGPDVRRTPRWLLALASARVRRRAGCLVWIAPGPGRS
jgi:hypothetical protein